MIGPRMRYTTAATRTMRSSWPRSQRPRTAWISAEERDRPRPVSDGEGANGHVAEPGAVDEEVERHDECEGGLEDRLADGPRHVDRVARPHQVGQGVLDLGCHRGHGDRLRPEHDRVAADELAERGRKSVGAAPREELELADGLAGQQVARHADRGQCDDVADEHDERPGPAEAPLRGRDERTERIGHDGGHDERPEDRAPDPGNDEDGDDEDAERPHGRPAGGDRGRFERLRQRRDLPGENGAQTITRSGGSGIREGVSASRPGPRDVLPTGPGRRPRRRARSARSTSAY